jgi:hypothetical protein
MHRRSDRNIDLCFAFGIYALRLSFTNDLADTVFWAVGYFAYCVLAASSLRIPVRLVRYMVLIIAALPMAGGYVLGTVGILGLGFVVHDSTARPEREQEWNF